MYHGTANKMVALELIETNEMLEDWGRTDIVMMSYFQRVN